MGRTQTLEFRALGHNEGRKKQQQLLPNCQYATIWRIPPFIMSQHMNFLELQGEVDKWILPDLQDSSATYWCYLLLNQTYDTILPWRLKGGEMEAQRSSDFPSPRVSWQQRIFLGHYSLGEKQILHRECWMCLWQTINPRKKKRRWNQETSL